MWRQSMRSEIPTGLRARVPRQGQRFRLDVFVAGDPGIEDSTAGCTYDGAKSGSSDHDTEPGTEPRLLPRASWFRVVDGHGLDQQSGFATNPTAQIAVVTADATSPVQ